MSRTAQEGCVNVPICYHGHRYKNQQVPRRTSAASVAQEFQSAYKFLLNINALPMTGVGWGTPLSSMQDRRNATTPVIPYKSGYLLSVLSLSHTECKTKTIMGISQVIFIPITSVRSALTWLVIVCWFGKSDKTMLFALRCVKCSVMLQSWMPRWLGVFGESIRRSFHTVWVTLLLPREKDSPSHPKGPMHIST